MTGVLSRALTPLLIPSWGSFNILELVLHDLVVLLVHRDHLSLLLFFSHLLTEYHDLKFRSCLLLFELLDLALDHSVSVCLQLADCLRVLGLTECREITIEAISVVDHLIFLLWDR